MYKKLLCSIVSNCQELETTKCPLLGDKLHQLLVHLQMKCYHGAVKMSEVVLSGRKECPNVLLNGGGQVARGHVKYVQW